MKVYAYLQKSKPARITALIRANKMIKTVSMNVNINGMLIKSSSFLSSSALLDLFYWLLSHTCSFRWPDMGDVWTNMIKIRSSCSLLTNTINHASLWWLKKNFYRNYKGSNFRWPNQKIIKFFGIRMKVGHSNHRFNRQWLVCNNLHFFIASNWTGGIMGRRTLKHRVTFCVMKKESKSGGWNDYLHCA